MTFTFHLYKSPDKDFGVQISSYQLQYPEVKPLVKPSLKGEAALGHAQFP